MLATNVAETSLTVPGIRYVIDVGTARISLFDPHQGESSSRQTGFAGQCPTTRRPVWPCGAGVCIRLYSEESFRFPRRVHRPGDPAHQPCRGDLADGLATSRRRRRVPLRTGPDPRAIRDGLGTLLELGAISETSIETAKGLRRSAAAIAWTATHRRGPHDGATARRPSPGPDAGGGPHPRLPRPCSGDRRGAVGSRCT